MAFKLHPSTHIGAVKLRVANLEGSIHFYKDVLGFKVLARGHANAALGAELGKPILYLDEFSGATPRPRRSTGLYHFAILMPDRPALGKSLRHLAEQRYPLHGAADHLVSEALYLDDPDRNGIELYRDRLKSEWTYEGNLVQMANEPVDLESLLIDAGESDFEGLRPETTIGHVHLHVRDLKEAEDFYCGLLGFDVMLRWPPSALFVSAGGYHHHLGLNTWAGEGAPPPPSHSAGLEHFEVVLPDLDALERVYDELHSAKVQLSRSASAIDFADPSRNGIRMRVEGGS